VGELEAKACELNPDIILVTETWARPELPDAFFSLPGYKLQTDLRKDREDTANGVGGGLIVYTRTGLVILPFDTQCNFHQHCSFSVKSGSDILNIILLYRPPTSGPNSVLDLEHLINSAPKETVIFGDFNLPQIDWANGQAPNRLNNIIDVCSDKFFNQLVEFPTHLKGNVLDLILTNTPGRVAEIREEGRLSRSDHIMIAANIMVTKPPETTIEQVPNWAKADWVGLKRQLSRAGLTRQMEEAPVEEAWEILKNALLRSVEENVPKKPRRSKNKNPWMNRDILRALRRKKQLWTYQRNTRRWKKQSKTS